MSKEISDRMTGASQMCEFGQRRLDLHQFSTAGLMTGWLMLAHLTSPAGAAIYGCEQAGGTAPAALRMDTPQPEPTLGHSKLKGTAQQPGSSSVSGDGHVTQSGPLAGGPNQLLFDAESNDILRWLYTGYFSSQ